MSTGNCACLRGALGAGVRGIYEVEGAEADALLVSGIATTRAACRVSICGTWISALRAWFCSRRVGGIGTFYSLRSASADNVRLAVTPTTSSIGRSEGAWDSIHVFEVRESGRTANYRLTSTVMLHLSTRTDALGDMNLSGNMTRQVEQILHMSLAGDAGHIANIGKVGLIQP